MVRPADDVHEEALRVPLLVEAIGYAPIAFGATRAYASQVDIAPTILRELGLAPPAIWAGRPLQDPSEGGFSYFQQSGKVGLFDRRDPGRLWKYYMNVRTGEDRAFDVIADPKERQDLLKMLDPALVAQMARECDGDLHERARNRSLTSMPRIVAWALVPGLARGAGRPAQDRRGRRSLVPVGTR